MIRVYGPQQRVEDTGVEVEASVLEGISTQLPVDVEEGENGAVGEEGMPERGGQPPFQFGATALGQRPFDVSAQDVRKRLARRKVQHCRDALLERVASGSIRRTTWKCGTREGSRPLAYICSTSCSERPAPLSSS